MFKKSILNKETKEEEITFNACRVTRFALYFIKKKKNNKKKKISLYCATYLSCTSQLILISIDNLITRKHISNQNVILCSSVLNTGISRILVLNKKLNKKRRKKKKFMTDCENKNIKY